jgi:predicted ATPase with chaperone activity
MPRYAVHNLAIMLGSSGAGTPILAWRLGTMLPQDDMGCGHRHHRSPRLAGWTIGPIATVISRQFRTLDHTVFEASLIDGGRVSMATEVPLAYQDILFLDELTESPCNVLGVLRQPLEVERVAHALIRPVEQSPGVRSTIHEVITSSDQKPSSLKGLYDADKGMVLFSLAE